MRFFLLYSVFGIVIVPPLKFQGLGFKTYSLQLFFVNCALLHMIYVVNHGYTTSHESYVKKDLKELVLVELSLYKPLRIVRMTGRKPCREMSLVRFCVNFS